MSPNWTTKARWKENNLEWFFVARCFFFLTSSLLMMNDNQCHSDKRKNERTNAVVFVEAYTLKWIINNNNNSWLQCSFLFCSSFLSFVFFTGKDRNWRRLNRQRQQRMRSEWKTWRRKSIHRKLIIFIFAFCCANRQCCVIRIFYTSILNFIAKQRTKTSFSRNAVLFNYLFFRLVFISRRLLLIIRNRLKETEMDKKLISLTSFLCCFIHAQLDVESIFEFYYAVKTEFLLQRWGLNGVETIWSFMIKSKTKLKLLNKHFDYKLCNL